MTREGVGRNRVLGVSPSLFYLWQHVLFMDIEQSSMMEAIDYNSKAGVPRYVNTDSRILKGGRAR